MRRILIFTGMPLQQTPAINCAEDAWLTNSSPLTNSLSHISNPFQRTNSSLFDTVTGKHYSYPSADSIGDVLKRQVKC